MSLETAYQRLRKAEKETSFKKLLLLSFVISIACVGIVFLNNTNYLTHYQEPLLKVIIILMFLMAFMTLPMIFIAGPLAFGIILTLFLIKCRDIFYYTNAIITGKSLSFNDTFLNYLTENLFPRLTGFIKSYNDPRFDESDLRTGRLENDVEELKAERVYNYRIIAEQKRTIFDLKEINKKQDELIKQLQSKECVKEQQIGENIHAQDINENTKIDDENKKFEPKD